ncbi:MAG: hypothetical protein O3A08_10050 [Proteobacteria bacterium]|nr:hypothetical protein [Pseudomonadota bacterium]MDA1286747.1 hypothetical protein [Pseudomonadota bacterium]
MMYYGGFGGGMWVGFLIVAVLLVVPFWRILPRNGIPNWVALVAIIPLGAGSIVGRRLQRHD